MFKFLSVPKSVSEISLGGEQGMVKCTCTAGCKAKRCSCRSYGSGMSVWFCVALFQRQKQIKFFFLIL